ncbi:uncharacterized protein LOC129959230 [Argiope bruennichi]|uniref:uncharacterized protein LOC129959230 n=1 Tax=Argiope bruennichi TaxID=94029 RepID=UPI00249574B2|nr:uncharacterized protein LOC129959230 [Argiope bruennichi]
MQALKTQGKVFRTAFTLCIKNIEAKLQNETAEVEEFSLLKVQLKDKFQRLEDYQQSIATSLLQDEENESLFETDFVEAEKYRDRFLEVMSHLNLKLTEKLIPINPPTKINFKLPQLQLKKFNGGARDYLAFWSQFQKIPANPGIPNENKMQYLIQAVEEGSKAERLVQNFPATASNYQLPQRFGRDDLLVQIYVRHNNNEDIVMKNATSRRMKISFPTLYDELEGKLRALESLGKTGDFLTPLVESCLLEEVLIAWDRKGNKKRKNDASITKRVEDKHCRRKEVSIVSEKQTGPPTAAALVSLSRPDLLGSLLTGEIVELDCGLTVVHTKLG